MNNIINNKSRKVFDKNNKKIKHRIKNAFKFIHNNIQIMNQSKIFAGIMIIILNITSKFMIIQLPETVESYLKFTFSRDLLIFAIAWMGTRDIYIALGIVFIFILVVDCLCNEKSLLCILPHDFINLHAEKLKDMNNTFTQQDLQNIRNLAQKIEKEFESDNANINGTTEQNINNETKTDNLHK
jgi:hypothetical protein